MGGRASFDDFLADENSGDTQLMQYLVYENRIGFPVRLNVVVEFNDIRSAVLFAREKALSYVEKGLYVDSFNGHDWVWYAVNLKDGADKGVLLQIFVKSESQNGEILIPTEYTIGETDAA